MNSKFIINIVTTNAGWIARQSIKYMAVGTAILAAWLHGRGLPDDMVGVITAAVASLAFGAAELTLSYIAKNYAVTGDAVTAVKDALDAARKTTTVVLAFLACLLLVQCTGVAAFFASPLGQTAIVTVEALTKQLVTAEVDHELELIIRRGTAQIAARTAQGTLSDIVKESKRQAEIVMYQGIVDGAQNQYVGMTGHRYTLPKNPVVVTP